MLNFNKAKLRSQLKRHEGLRLKTYSDSVGVPTIGYGKNLLELEITEGLANQWLNEDIDNVAIDLENAFPFVKRLSEVRQLVLLNMCFNLGINRLKTFRKMWKALERKDYIVAAAEMEDSLWFKQVGTRAEELVKQMIVG